MSAPNMKKLLSEWAVFGVQIPFSAERMVSYELKLDTLVERVQYLNIRTCIPNWFRIYMRIHKNPFNRIFFHFSGNHVECVEIDYDPRKISYKQLLDLFWNNHEYGLTTRVKRQYISIILYHTDQQKCIAIDSMNEESVKRSPEVIITKIATAGPFHPAEE